MRTVILDIVKFLLLAALLLGVVALLAGCGSDFGKKGKSGFEFGEVQSLPPASELSALIKVSDSRFPHVTNFAYQVIPVPSYFADSGKYELVCFVWNKGKSGTLPVLEVFVDAEGFEYHIADPGYGRRPQEVAGAFAEVVGDPRRGIVPIYTVPFGEGPGSILLLTADFRIAQSNPDSFVSFYAFHPNTPR